jgi:hypothetical protein
MMGALDAALGHVRQVVYEAASTSGPLGSGGELRFLAAGQRLGEAFHGDVAAADQPVVVLLGEDRADQADHGGAVGEDADDVGAPADLAVQTFEWVVRPNLAPVLAGEGGEGEDVLGSCEQQVGSLGKRSWSCSTTRPCCDQTSSAQG